MSQETELKRQLKIKLGVCKRLTKEVEMYTKEAEQQRNKIEKMKEEGKDEADIRKQIEVLEETNSIIPDTKNRSAQSYKTLSEHMNIIAESEFASTFQDTNDDWKTANTLLESQQHQE